MHGHFYQPPRENPWLEDIEVQDSAFPYHDWNERINLECYASNTASRILDGDGDIAEIVNNYADISFNFGPTLLQWMEKHAPRTYQRILDADRESISKRSGHGNALAQVYNHLIMPLASRRDKVTQAVWGIKDFQKRFGRAPEGMWLAETAADTETLEVLAELGIKFTILAPSQAARVRPLADETAPWEDVADGRVDPSRPYLWVSPKGLQLALFFYDGPISRAIAFEGLLGNGEYFVGRLMNGFSEGREGAQLVNVATDGESYGHHHRFGDMALAYAVKKIRREGLATLTNYGEYLEKHPPQWQADIHENSSWSCVHGVERWRSDCGCRIGYGQNWNQQWRGPLRDSLNSLRDAVDKLYEQRASGLLKDPWRAREDYIDVVFHRTPEALDGFMREHQARPLDAAERVDAVKLLEMQRHRLYMFTSCGWFFDEISGIESQAILLSAARALQIAQGFPGSGGMEENFLDRLSVARSNVPDLGDGARVYARYVKPFVTDLPRVAAHLGIRGLFQKSEPEGKLYCYSYRVLDQRTEPAGKTALSVGRVRVASEVTRGGLEVAFAILHLGGQDFHGVLKPSAGGADYEETKRALFETFQKGSLADVIALLGKHFEPRTFTLQDLFIEDRRRLLRTVIRDILGRFDGVYRQLVDENRKLIGYLVDAGFPIPEGFRLAVRYLLDQELERLVDSLAGTPEESQQVERLKREAQRFGLNLDFSPLVEAVRKHVEEKVDMLAAAPSAELARSITGLLDLGVATGQQVYLWQAENVFYDAWNARFGGAIDPGRAEDPLVKPLAELARRFRFKVGIPVA